ncbi:MAG: hypothetical protein ABSD30_14840 [Candidatus Binatus sp.]
MEKDKTWQKCAGSQVVLDSIFAALAAIWITFALNDHPRQNLRTWSAFAEVMCSLFSFFLFAISAEGTTTAYDDNDVLKYVYYLFWYNIGVIFISIAIGAFVFARFETLFLSVAGSLYVPIALSIVLFVILLWRWICDACWLVFGNKFEFEQYLRELKDEGRPVRDHGKVMRFFFWRRV